MLMLCFSCMRGSACDSIAMCRGAIHGGVDMVLECVTHLKVVGLAAQMAAGVLLSSVD